MEELYPAYSLVFTGFDVFKDRKGWLHSFSMRSNDPPFFRFSGALNMTIVELDKFLSLRPENLLDMASLWCYLLRKSGVMDMESARELAGKGKDMKEATDHLIKLSKDEKISLYKEASGGRRLSVWPGRIMSGKRAWSKAFKGVWSKASKEAWSKAFREAWSKAEERGDRRSAGNLL